MLISLEVSHKKVTEDWKWQRLKNDKSETQTKVTIGDSAAI